MDQVLAWLKEQISTNHFFQGGFVLMALGSALYWLRHLPLMIYGWCKWLILVTVSFDERSILYDLFQAWVNDAELMKSKRDVVLTVDDKRDPPRLVITPDRRGYWVSVDGVWCRLAKARDKEGLGSDDSASNADGSGGSMFRPPERYWITCCRWRRKKILAKLAEIVKDYGVSQNDEIPVYVCRWGWWSQRYRQPRRPLDHLIFKEGQMEDITTDLHTFINDRLWYDERQIPYQRGYIFSGPPGTGKTSLAAALAAHFRLRLCILDLGAVDNDRELKEAFLSAPGRSIILVEDFDSFFDGRDMVAEGSKVTFSGFLNAVNGVVSNPGRVLIMTTNKPGIIDPALTRIGRIDRNFHLGYVDPQQAMGIMSRFFPGANAKKIALTAQKVKGKEVSPADLVGHLQRYRDDLGKALDLDVLLDDRDERTRLDHELREATKRGLTARGEALVELFRKDEAVIKFVTDLKVEEGLDPVVERGDILKILEDSLEAVEGATVDDITKALEALRVEIHGDFKFTLADSIRSGVQKKKKKNDASPDEPVPDVAEAVA